MLSEFNLKEKGWDLLLKDISEREGSVDPQIITTVTEVLNNVRINKDKALKEYTEKFDHVKLTAENMKVTAEEIEEVIREKSAPVFRALDRTGYECFHREMEEEQIINVNTPELYEELLKSIERDKK